MPAEVHESKLIPLTGTVDGFNRTFESPTAFVAGSVRVFVNGQAQDKDDGRLGWVELNDHTIRMFVAPKNLDFLQAFYQELCEVPWIGNVRGSPFDPNGVIP